MVLTSHFENTVVIPLTSALQNRPERADYNGLPMNVTLNHISETSKPFIVYATDDTGDDDEGMLLRFAKSLSS